MTEATDHEEPKKSVSVVSRLDKIVMQLQQYNEWRRGADTEQPDALEIGRNIDAAVDELKKAKALLEAMMNYIDDIGVVP